MIDRVQRQRFEIKYLISQQTAVRVRNFVKSYLTLDEFSAATPGGAYSIHSLYLDSADLKLYRSTVNGDSNRYKLRLRYYDDCANATVFAEIKSRANNTISKERAAVPATHFQQLAQGQLPDGKALDALSGNATTALHNFCNLANRLHARPKTHVAYQREAWMGTSGNSLRITFDHDVRIEPRPVPEFTTLMRNPQSVFGNQVVLEVKFTDRYPEWIAEMTRQFDLTRGSAAKYADGIDVIGEHQVLNRFAVPSSFESGAAPTRAGTRSGDDE